MSLLVTGSIGIDTVETPFGKRQDVIGGSAVYFAYAASFFTPVRLVGVVGEDCPPRYFDVFKGRDVDMSGLEVRKGSKTFRWHGRYHADINVRDTVSVDLNVLAEKAPRIPPAFLDSRFVFLANTHPALQLEMLRSLKQPRLVVADTMDLWIQTEHKALSELLKVVDGLVLNDEESRLLSGKTNLIRAARDVVKLGPSFVVLKKGEHGAIMCTSDDIFVLPAYPADEVVDPTGAGDSFAGGMMGYLAAANDITPRTIRAALAYGTVVASYAIEDFSLGGLQATSREQVDDRCEAYRRAMNF